MGEAVTPSVKGTIFATAVAAVRRLQAAGGLPEPLARRLSPAARGVLDERILDGAWYPIQLHCELLRLLRDAEGDGRREYLVEGGREAARALEASGLYRQMRAAHGIRDLDRLGPVLVSMAGSIYNFTEWRFLGGDPAASVVEVAGAAGFPDEVRWRAEGFIEQAVSHYLERRVTVRSERSGPDTLLFHVALG